MLLAFREDLRITQRIERLKRWFAEFAATFALAVLAVVGEIKEADAVRAACIGEMSGGVQMLAGGAAEGKDVVTGPHFVAFPNRVTELEVECGTGCQLANSGEVVLLGREIMRGCVHHVDTSSDERF